MKNKLLLFLCILFLGWFFSVNAQSTGDFQSNKTGNWSDVNSWERYDGSSWINPAPGVPDSTSGIITILNGHTITVDGTVIADQIVVNAAGTILIGVNKTLIVADGADSIDMVVYGTLNNFGTLTIRSRISFESGGFYINSNSAAALPGTGIIAWRNGSTCRIDSTSGSSPSNLNLQNLYNLIWNGTNSGANGGPNFPNNYVLAGDLTVLSTKVFSSGLAIFQEGKLEIFISVEMLMSVEQLLYSHLQEAALIQQQR